MFNRDLELIRVPPAGFKTLLFNPSSHVHNLSLHTFKPVAGFIWSILDTHNFDLHIVPFFEFGVLDLILPVLAGLDV